MKSRFFAAVGVALPGFAMAASSSHDVSVTANVVSHCHFNATSGTTMAFGNLDPTVGSDVTKTVQIPFRCTKSTSISGAVGEAGQNDAGAVHRLLGPTATDLIPYSVTITGQGQTGLGFGAGGDLNLTVEGTILGTDYVDAAAGGYADTLRLTINP